MLQKLEADIRGHIRVIHNINFIIVAWAWDEDPLRLFRRKSGRTWALEYYLVEWIKKSRQEILAIRGQVQVVKRRKGIRSTVTDCIKVETPR